MITSVPHLLTVNETADRLRISQMTLYRLIRAGEVPAMRIGNQLRVDEQELAQYLTDQRLGEGRS